MAPPQTERRQFGRRQSRLHGWICAEGRESVPCLIMNLSPRGAFLACEPPSWLPFHFRLDIPFCKSTELCEIRHVRPDGVGVTFHEDERRAEPAETAPLLIEEAESWIGEKRDREPRPRQVRQLSWPSTADARQIRISAIRSAASGK